jgi:hypothetical protein
MTIEEISKVANYELFAFIRNSFKPNSMYHVSFHEPQDVVFYAFSIIFRHSMCTFGKDTYFKLLITLKWWVTGANLLRVWTGTKYKLCYLIHYIMFLHEGKQNF